MSVQTAYNYTTSRGIAGGLLDLSPYSIYSRTNDEADGILHYGIGVVKGAFPGISVMLPSSVNASSNFEGVLINELTTQQNVFGNTYIINGQSVGVLCYGHCWVQVTDTANPSYGIPLRLVIAGVDAGKFTEKIDASSIAVNGQFLGTADFDGIAPVELFNQQNQ